MITVKTGTLSRTDPVTYLPETDSLDTNEECRAVAVEILNGLSRRRIQHYRPSAVAAAAVYVAGVVTPGESLSQTAAAGATGSTSKSVRRHMPTVASGAVTNESVTGRESVDVDALSRLSDGVGVPDLSTG